MKFKSILAALGFLLFTSCEYNSIEKPVRCDSYNLTLSLAAKKDANCGQSDGSFQVSARGGSGVYTFSVNNGSFQKDSIFQNMATGSYVVSVKDHDCATSLNVDIQNQNGLNVLVTSVNAGCGTTNGSITVTPSGGVLPIMFSLNEGNFSSSASFANLAAGDYKLLTKDASGCEITKSIKIESGVSFSKSISGIISANCAVSGCHNGSQDPDFRVFNNIQSYAADIKSQTSSRNMPLGRSITKEQIDAIACWVNDGALNN